MKSCNFAQNFNFKMLNSNKKHLWEAFSYVFLLVIFTYSTVMVELLKDFCGVWDAYAYNQGSGFGLLTNFGLLLLLVIDYISGKSKVDAYAVARISTCFFVYTVIFGHARVVSRPVIYKDYEVLLSVPNLFIFLHLMTLMYLVFVKYQTLKEYKVSKI